MTTIYVDASEVHELADDIRTHADELPAKAQVVVEKTGFEMEAEAKVLCPVDTGNLMNSISLDVSALSFELGPTADYGDDVERGVPHPFVIRAKPGGVLHFQIDGRDVFATSVTHPPMAPQPYLGPAFDSQLPHLETALGDLGERVFHA